MKLDISYTNIAVLLAALRSASNAPKLSAEDKQVRIYESLLYYARKRVLFLTNYFPGCLLCRVLKGCEGVYSYG